MPYSEIQRPDHRPNIQGPNIYRTHARGLKVAKKGLHALLNCKKKLDQKVKVRIIGNSSKYLSYTRSWTQGQKRIEYHPFSQGVDPIFTAHTPVDSMSQKRLECQIQRPDHRKLFQIFIVHTLHTLVDSRSQKGLNTTLFLKGSVSSLQQKDTFLSSTKKT